MIKQVTSSGFRQCDSQYIDQREGGKKEGRERESEREEKKKKRGICAAIIITGAGREGYGDVDRNTKLVQRRQLGKGLVASCLNQR